jgi:hypothetical protein
MTSEYSWLAGALLVAMTFAACGGSSKGDEAAGAGAPSTAAGTAGAGAGKGGGQSGGASNGGASNGGATTGGGGSSSAGQASAECSIDACGPQLGLPNWTCDDGSMGGPTGRCLEMGEACGWEIRECPATGEGGASGQGGQGSLAGAAAGGADSGPCGGCAAEQVCVYQEGGPGPSRFTCASQNPCGAPGACACIVGQGACEPTLMGEPPNTYCTCDSGLD